MGGVASAPVVVLRRSTPSHSLTLWERISGGISNLATFAADTPRTVNRQSQQKYRQLCLGGDRKLRFMTATASSILELAESGRADELRDILRDRCLRSVYYWSKVIAGYSKLTDYLHLPFCNHVQDTALDIRKRGYLY